MSVELQEVKRQLFEARDSDAQTRAAKKQVRTGRYGCNGRNGYGERTRAAKKQVRTGRHGCNGRNGYGERTRAAKKQVLDG